MTIIPIIENNATPKSNFDNPFANLQTPPYIQNNVRYDFLTNRYILEKKIGFTLLSEPLSMTPEEYKEYKRQQIQIDFFVSETHYHTDKLKSLYRDTNSLREERKKIQAGVSFWSVECKSILMAILRYQQDLSGT